MFTDIAFVLHKRSYKESSELVKLLTKKHGIIDVITKGSRRAKSPLYGQLMPFLQTEVTFTGRSELKTLTGASQQGTLLKCAYKNHVSMLYCNELMTLIQIDNELSGELFDQYEYTVMSLQKASSVSLILRRFEWLLSGYLGYALQFPESISSDDFLSFDPYKGLLVNNKDQICSVLVLEKFTSNQTLSNQEIKQVNLLMKSVVNHLVHGKIIQSRLLLMN